MSSIITMIIVVVLFALVFGAVLYVVTNILLKRLGREKKGAHTKHIWVWRITLFLAMIYIFIVLWLNRNVLEGVLYYGELSLLLAAFLVIFFITLLDIAVIDLLLPDIITFWKRVALEIALFFLIGASSMIVFILFSTMLV